jgi:hypothetical protein
MDSDSVWVLIPLAAIAAMMIVRLKHGYDPSRRKSRRGNSVDVELESETASLRQENAALKAQLARMEDRMRTMEKIVTDPSRRLADEIERLS